MSRGYQQLEIDQVDALDRGRRTALATASAHAGRARVRHQRLHGRARRRRAGRGPHRAGARARGDLPGADRAGQHSRSARAAGRARRIAGAPRDPALRRHAVAAEPDTTLVASAASRARPTQPSAWEHYFAAGGRSEGGDPAGPAAAEAGLAEHPEHPVLLYNAACYASLAGAATPRRLPRRPTRSSRTGLQVGRTTATWTRSASGRTGRCRGLRERSRSPAGAGRARPRPATARCRRWPTGLRSASAAPAARAPPRPHPWTASLTETTSSAGTTQMCRSGTSVSAPTPWPGPQSSTMVPVSAMAAAQPVITPSTRRAPSHVGIAQRLHAGREPGLRADRAARPAGGRRARRRSRRPARATAGLRDARARSHGTRRPARRTARPGRPTAARAAGDPRGRVGPRRGRPARRADARQAPPHAPRSRHHSRKLCWATAGSSRPAVQPAAGRPRPHAPRQHAGPAAAPRW